MNEARRGVAAAALVSALALAVAAGALWYRSAGDLITLRLGGPPAVAPSHPSDTSLPATAPAPELRCPGSRQAAPAQQTTASGPTAHQLVLTTADGVKLAAVRVGAGQHGVVLVHDGAGDLCTWWRYAQRLADRGFHVLAFDLRCYGYSECGRNRDYTADAAAAVVALRHAGATRVVLVGAGLGADVALVAAARASVPTGAGSGAVTSDTTDDANGVVALSLSPPGAILSGESGAPGPRTVADAVPMLGVPLVFCVADGDGQGAPPAQLRELAGRALSRQSEVLVEPGARHGADLATDLTGGTAARVIAFLSAYT